MSVGEGVQLPEVFSMKKTITFTGTATHGGAGSSVTVLTPTGAVEIVQMVPYCTVNLGVAVAGGQVALETTNHAGLFIAAMDSVDINAGYPWLDATPTEKAIAVPAAFKDIILADAEAIIIPCTVQNTNSGTVVFDILWRPVTAGATLA